MSNVKRDQPCYSFVLLPKQDRGKFQPSVAIKLGCVPNLHFKPLTDGKPVTLANGTVVDPSQVLDQPPPSQAMIFVFLPSHHYLEGFLQKGGEFEQYSSAN